MATVNLEKMSAVDRLALANQLALFQHKDAKLKELVDAFRAELDVAGFSAEDAAKALVPPKPRGRPAGQRSAAKKTRTGASSSADSTGATPQAGKTYVHPTTGEEWTKAASGKGAPRRSFVDLVASGSTTWKQLSKSGASKAPKAARAGARKVSAKKKA